MPNVKEKMAEIIQAQPEDATYEEIMRELAFERMIDKGLQDSRKEKVLSNEEVERRIHGALEIDRYFPELISSFAAVETSLTRSPS